MVALVAGWVIFALGIIGSIAFAFHVQSSTNADEHRHVRENCLEREELKRVIREILDSSIEAAILTGTPAGLRRAQEYRRAQRGPLRGKDCP